MKSSDKVTFPKRVWIKWNGRNALCRTIQPIFGCVAKEYKEFVALSEFKNSVSDAFLTGKLEALKFCDAYTDGAYAGIKAEIAQTEAIFMEQKKDAAPRGKE